MREEHPGESWTSAGDDGSDGARKVAEKEEDESEERKIRAEDTQGRGEHGGSDDRARRPSAGVSGRARNGGGGIRIQIVEITARVKRLQAIRQRTRNPHAHRPDGDGRLRNQDNLSHFCWYVSPSSAFICLPCPTVTASERYRPAFPMPGTRYLHLVVHY